VSVLQNQIFADYQFMVAAVSHRTKTHKPEKRVDPKTKEETERCPLYPSIPCSVHENLSVPGLDYEGTPATFILDPEGKVIFGDKEMQAAFSAGATVKKLEEAQKRLGPGLARALYDKLLKDLAEIDADLAAEKYERAIRSAKKMLDAKQVPPAMKEGRVKVKLSEIEARGEAILEEAKGKREAEPEAALALAKKVVSQFKGTEAGKAAAELVKEWEAPK
jgi:hypothetical protein